MSRDEKCRCGVSASVSCPLHGQYAARHVPVAPPQAAPKLTDLYDFSGVAPQAEAPTPTLQEFWNAQSEWSQATFGTDSERGPIGPLKHLEKEAREAQEHPTDPFEFADCLFLVFDSARRAGFTLDQLTRFCWQKLEINKQRKYPKTTDMNAAVEHER